MTISIYTLTSPLHDEAAVAATTREFLSSLNIDYTFKGNDFSDYGTSSLDLIYVRTGGAEGLFLKLLPEMQSKSTKPFYLLTSGKSNSLAASMEILSFLNQKNIKGEIIHGSASYINRRITLLAQAGEARNKLNGSRLGIIGDPSDWLISSKVCPDDVRRALGIELVSIPMQELIDEFNATQGDCDPVLVKQAPTEGIRRSLPDAWRIYLALKKLVQHYHLSGLTIRCFDLLTSVHNTGCIALARLNSEGIVAGCEGDVPAMLSMAITRAALGISGFQANPAQINPETGEMKFAHCTIPFNMVERYELDTHFESGIGVGIRGYMANGDVTIFKVSGDLQRHFIEQGTLERSEDKPDLCRTQQIIRLCNPEATGYFLTRPIGNHHIIIPGNHKELLKLIIG